MPRKQKYNNKKVTIDGYTFDSTNESRWYIVYRDDPTVIDLQVHPRYTLVPKFTNANGIKRRARSYIADFLVTYEDGRQEIVDVKGFETPLFKLKRDVFEYTTGKVITIVK